MLTHKGTLPLETSRLLLRRMTIHDAKPMFCNWANDPDVTRFLTWPPHRNLDVTTAVISDWLVQYNRNDYYQWAIVLKELGDQPIGSISVVSLNEQTACAEIGYCLGKAWWHQGIMSEALQAVIDYLFDQVGMNRVEAKHDPNNPRSGAVMRKCAMQYEGTTRSSGRNNQGICDTACYGLLRIDRNPRNHFMTDYSPVSDEDLVQELYQRFDESSRLSSSKASQVEFHTTVRYIEQFLKSGDKILDIGAGTGVYSYYFSRKGYSVSALELSHRNVEIFRSQITPSDNLDIIQGNAMDLSCYPEAFFDIVLMLGPMYHLHQDEDKLCCIQEAKRVCKPGGKIFFGFISNDIVLLTMQQTDPNYLLTGPYDKSTFRLKDFPFVFHTIDRCRNLLALGGIRIIKEIAADGVSELIQNTINAMDKPTYAQYLRYHDYLCEKQECLGMSNHLLFIGEAEN